MTKKRLSVLVVFVMLITNFTFLSSGVSYADAPQKDKYELASDVLAELFEINKLLSEVGLDLDMLSNLSNRDKKYYEAMANRVIETTSDPQLKLELIEIISDSKINPNPDNSKPSEEAKTSSDRWVYATQMAIQNRKHDPTVTDLTKETMYMYMSHYIDIPTGIITEGIDKSISNDQYFSAWITKDDREVYDRFISDIKISDKIYAVSDAILNTINIFFLKVPDLKALLNKFVDARADICEWLKRISTAYAKPTKNLVDDYFLFRDTIEGEDNPVIAADNLTKTLTTKYGDDYSSQMDAKKVISSLAKLGSIYKDKEFDIFKEVKGMGKSFGVDFAKMINDDLKNFYNKTRWKVMLFSIHGRVSLRLSKYLYGYI